MPIVKGIFFAVELDLNVPWYTKLLSESFDLAEVFFCRSVSWENANDLSGTVVSASHIRKCVCRYLHLFLYIYVYVLCSEVLKRKERGLESSSTVIKSKLVKGWLVKG